MSDDKQRDPSTEAALPAGGARGPERQTLVALDQTPRASQRQQTGQCRTARPTSADASDVPGGPRMTDDPSSHPGFNYQNPVYQGARDAAFARSGGLCQLCGQQPAVEAHHWAVDYPPAH